MGLIALDMQSDGRMGNYYTVAQCEAKVMCGNVLHINVLKVKLFMTIILNLLYRSTAVLYILYNTAMNMTYVK